jgi:hypothetical protein
MFFVRKLQLRVVREIRPRNSILFSTCQSACVKPAINALTFEFETFGDRKACKTIKKCKKPSQNAARV